MARDRDRGDSASPCTGQSKRNSTAHDSQSLDSNDIITQQHQQQQQQHHHPAQRKPQKHHVGGAGGRLHARVPSSKGLYKHNATTSSTKLNSRRVTSPSPDRSSSSHHHRRNPSSEVKLSRDSSGTNLKKNASSSSLAAKRNRSHVEVAKRNKSASQLKRTSSEKAVSKTRAVKSGVHFDLGNDGQQDDNDDWVDASSSASPYLSRRGSVNNSGQSSGRASASPTTRGGDDSAQGPEDEQDGDEEPTPHVEVHKDLLDDTLQHSRNLTSRLLQRTPSHSATTSMSTTMAMARAASPDSRHSTSTLSVTPAHPQGISESNGKDEVTSRFITQASGGSFYDGGRSVSGSARPVSVGDLERGDTGLSTATTQVKDDDEMTDEEDAGIASAIATTARRRKEGTPVTAALPEKSRTQQKINLQRASSSMEPVRHRHSGIGGFAAEVAEVAGPLLGGAGYESQDPRVNKLLERTGVEYNIVRRYQNPVARSLSRLAQLPGNDKARRIPKGPTSRHSVHNFGLSQSFRDQNGAATRRPETPKRAFSAARHNGAGSSLDTDDGAVAARMQQEGQAGGSRLSGASLVNGEDDDGIQSILRSMWDKNLGDLAASEE